jgi:outer membrane receptor protein involved in Fe transport
MKKMMALAGVVLVAGLSGAAVSNDVARENVVVTATRVEMPLASVGSSVTVVDREQMTQRQCPSVVQALREVPGLDVVQSGGAGGTASLFIRGAKSEQTLVLVDGVPLNDAAGLGRGADISQLPVENIERIEVLRGPQSTLYGADALRKRGAVRPPVKFPPKRVPLTPSTKKPRFVAGRPGTTTRRVPHARIRRAFPVPTSGTAILKRMATDAPKRQRAWAGRPWRSSRPTDSSAGTTRAMITIVPPWG